MTLEFKTLRAARRWFFYGLFYALAADGAESIDLDQRPPGEGEPSWTMRWVRVTVALGAWSSSQPWTKDDSSLDLLDLLERLVVDLRRGTVFGMPDALIDGALDFGLDVRGHKFSMDLPQSSAALRLLELEPEQRALFERFSKIMLGTC